MIQAHNLCLSFGTQPIFNKLSFTIGQHDRIGLVGRNGSGKSTLLKAFVDPSLLDAGSISIIRGKKIAYMPQDVVLLSQASILEETCAAFTAFHALQQEALLLEQQIAQNSNPTLLDRYAAVQEELSLYASEQLKAQAKTMLMGLGFSTAQFNLPVSSLSVGWKMRIVLAKLLLQKADFYLFDEPTNHLDLVAKEWFLSFLQHADFGFMLVCHERYFLDELCDSILELEGGNGTWYKGNYSTYIIQKEHDLELLNAAYVQQQKEIKRKKETIERFRASASKAKMAQSMIKALDKIELITLPPNARTVHFTFPPVEQSGKIVITITNVSHAFGEKKIFSKINCQIERGQKVALIAPNGAGKTTLFNLITGALPLQHGSIEFGYKVTYAIFAQDQNKALDGSKTILENLNHLCPKASEQTLRTFLGAFLFSSDDVHKKVRVLSGGEKNRVGMINVLLQQANLLLLDEPTNHLDIPSKEILLKALQEFGGTLLFVSHDRDFINSLATHVIELTSNGAYLYQGNYDAYSYQKKAAEATLASTQQPSMPENQARAKKNDTDQFALTKKSKRLEEKIERLEQRIKEVSLQFADIEYGTPDFKAAESNLHNLKKELLEAETQWEELQSALYH